MILVFFTMEIAGEEGASNFMGMALDIFISTSAYFIALLIFLPLLRKLISARACATLWLMPVFLFFQPTMLLENAYLPLQVLYIPEIVLRLFIYIWLAGFVILFAGEIISGMLFQRKLLKGARPIEEERILQLWEQEKKALRYKRPVRLLCSPELTTPLSMGIFKKTQATLLPDRYYTMDELRLIFRHELHHIQRRDVDTKIFLSFCRAMCWFNPLVWIAIRRASDDLELSCDEIVLENSGDSERRQYAELLLRTAGNSRGFTTCLSAAASSLRYRLKSVVQPHARRTGIALLAAMMLVCCMSYGSVSIVSDRGTVGSLVLSNIAAEDVSALYYYDDPNTDDSDDGYTLTSCSEELMAYLESLKADKLLNRSLSSFYDDAPTLSLEVETEQGERDISFNGRCLSVEDEDTGQMEYYLISPEMNAAYVKSFFDAD
ncbi:M56 family metallopeptidase [Anaerovorax odorimutans]|uniref:M56 family metallopeptidase n=2 Tax=Anaerovorax odorimutans TaxID=109327 RepID=A0ABT1RNG3_9FIRM|nr:M56 family metallopeptidase [Anaerovorax odorimutans]